jgi:hypothetical protein
LRIVDNMVVKGGQIEGDGCRSSLTRRYAVNGTGPKTNPPATEVGKPAKPVPRPAPIEDDDSEDGDIATPKRDRDGSDDEPL